MIGTVLPFEDMVKGHGMMAKAEQIGKIVIPHKNYSPTLVPMNRTLIFVPGNSARFINSAKKLNADIVCFNIRGLGYLSREIFCKGNDRRGRQPDR